MLLDMEYPCVSPCDETIRKAILTLDPTAQVTVQADNARVRVEGLLTPEQAITALAAAGYMTSPAAPHSGEGSSCCGGCS